MADFDYFVLFAEMRTGSNFLEANINRYPDLACLGEVFNPHFLAYPNTEELLGFTQAQRDADPMALVAAIRGQEGVQGFRFFHDHHAAILDQILDDRRCGKVILTRNPVESYVSWKIAQATGQWKLTNATHHKASQIEFDRAEFEAHLGNLQAFQIALLNTLQKSGQTAFYVAYEDIQDIEIMNGLARFLGSATQLEGLSKNLKKQNPAPMSEKVANYEAMEASLAALDRFDLTRTPNFEPRRGAVIPTYVAAQDAPLLYMPIRSGPEAQIKAWLGAFGGAPETNFTQKTLRQWKRSRKGHRSFTAIRHPVPRAYAAFERHIVGTGQGAYLEIRKTLMKVYNVPLAEDGPGAGWSAQDHRAAFLGFLAFLKMNLGGQTAVRVDAAWASQSSILAGFADFAQPDMVLREDNLEVELAMLCELAGVPCPALPDADPSDVPLEDVYDQEVEAAVRDVYQRDYMSFGFGPWQR
ncbi:MAG: sulfotransferase family 2 domain-containing protein [Pseudomonadota bacterium]